MPTIEACYSAPIILEIRRKKARPCTALKKRFLGEKSEVVVHSSQTTERQVLAGHV
jgi:hypothetical protein